MVMKPPSIFTRQLEPFIRAAIIILGAGNNVRIESESPGAPLQQSLLNNTQTLDIVSRCLLFSEKRMTSTPNNVNLEKESLP